MVLRSGAAPWFFKLWGIPFLVAGFYVTIGRFMWDAYRRSTTYYALTSDCALIVREGLGGGIQRVYLPAIQQIGFKLSPDGSGTISFGGPQPAYGYGYWNWGGGPLVPSFEDIPEARSIYDLCVSAQQSIRQEPAAH